MAQMQITWKAHGGLGKIIGQNKSINIWAHHMENSWTAVNIMAAINILLYYNMHKLAALICRNTE